MRSASSMTKLPCFSISLIMTASDGYPSPHWFMLPDCRIILFAASMTFIISATSVDLASLTFLFILIKTASPQYTKITSCPWPVLQTRTVIGAGDNNQLDSYPGSLDDTPLPYRSFPRAVSLRPKAADSSSVPH